MTGYLGTIRRAVRSHGLWLTALLTVAVFLGLFAFGQAAAVADAIASLHPWRIGAVFGLVAMSYAIMFLKWDFYLRTLGIDVPPRRSFVVFVSGLMVVVTPGKAGEVWKAWFLRDLESIPVSRTAPIVGAERVTDLLALATLALLGLVVFQQSSTAVVVVTVVFVSGLVLLQWQTLALHFLQALERIPVISDYADELEEFYQNTYTLFRPQPLVAAMIISLLAWGLEGVALWVVLGGFSPGASLLSALFVFGLGSVIGAASLLPGGLAAAEASMVSTLVILGYSRTIAVSSTLVIRVGTLWFGAVIGTLVFLSYRAYRRRS